MNRTTVAVIRQNGYTMRISDIRFNEKDVEAFYSVNIEQAQGARTPRIVNFSENDKAELDLRIITTSYGELKEEEYAEVIENMQLALEAVRSFKEFHKNFLIERGVL